ncbi:MAG: ATP-binding protein, partial [Rhodospirillales bacterium]
AVVLGNLEFLEETIGENDSRRRLVERACDGVRRGAQLTERLLAFSRKQHLEPEVLSVSQVVSATVEILRRTLGETISIQTSIAGNLHPILADRGQLENAILNLAVNARDAMSQGGTLSIDMRDVEIENNDGGVYGELTPGRYACIAVKDTGHGMTEDVKDRVFDPFFTTKESGHGTGMGLSMVYGFAKQSGGLVRIESEEGKGTTIEILLPAAINEKEKPKDTAGNNKNFQGRGETVLVVEDETEVRSLAVEMLYDLGYRVLEAENGDKAIDIVRDKPRIDLLFTDVLMPGRLTGKELAQEACRHAKNIKVIFTSGHPADHLSGDAPNAEKFTLIRKPYTKRKLAETIRSVLDS